MALGEVLVERGIVPVPPVFERRGMSMSTVIGASIDLAAHRWDSLVAEIQSRSATIEDQGATTERLLRFVVIDLSLRIFALLRLSGLDPERPGTPLWAQENGGGKLLRELTTRAGLTREQLTDRLGVSSTSVDNWLDGKVRPTNDSVSALADVLASEMKDVTPDQLWLKIQRQFTFVALTDLLEPWVGRQRILELSTALVRFVWMITDDVRQMDRPSVDEVPNGEFDALRFGTADPATCTLLRNLSTVEPDEGWRQDILAATLDWSVLFQSVVAQTNPTRTSAGLAQEVMSRAPSGTDQPSLGEPPTSKDPARDAVSQLGNEADDVLRRLAQGELPSLVGMLEAGIERRRAIARNFPLSPLAHSELGSFLGMAGKNLGRRDLADEGIAECKVAAELLPDWDTPAVETGIILGNIGAYEDALGELERARSTLPEETPHLGFNMGYVLMKLSRHAEALEYFERVLEVRPDYALAFLHAAHCAFMLGDKWTGQRHAKTARRLGEPGAYNAWRAGAYSSRNER